MKQVVLFEYSMSMVHLARGGVTPLSEHLRCETDIVRELARALLAPNHPMPWEALRTYGPIRDAIADVVPRCSDYNRRFRQPDDFQLPHPPRDSASSSRRRVERTSMRDS